MRSFVIREPLSAEKEESFLDWHRPKFSTLVSGKTGMTSVFVGELTSAVEEEGSFPDRCGSKFSTPFFGISFFVWESSAAAEKSYVDENDSQH